MQISQTRQAGPAFSTLALIGCATLIQCCVGCVPIARHDNAPHVRPNRKPLTLELAFGYGGVNFDGQYASGSEWLDDGRHYLIERNG